MIRNSDSFKNYYSKHAWYGNIFKRLKEDETELVFSFIKANEGLDKSVFEQKLNRHFLDRTDKPKHWKEITEAWMVFNSWRQEEK